MRIISFLIFLIFLVPAAFADAPLIWQSGAIAKFLTSQGFSLNDGKYYVSLTSDPSAGGGVIAPVGSVGVRSNAGAGELWLKTGVGNTAWSLAQVGVTDWSLSGNAGTGGTGILGTTDAQPFSIRANNTNLLTFGGTNPTISSSVTQVPADGVGLNQFDFRVFASPTVSTTNASHTGMFSQLVYDNGNTGFDSTGGSYIANSANFTNNGSGTLGFSSIYSGSASFNSTGTTSQFKGITSENGISSGATVSSYYGMVSGLNTTGGIVPDSTSLSLYGNFTDSTIGNSFGINQTLLFDGTTTNTAGAFGVNSSIQISDTTDFNGTSYAFNGGIDLNDDSVTNGFNGFNFYSNVRNNANTSGINLSSVSLNHTDAAVSTSANGYNTNMQFSGTSTTSGVNVFAGYARTFDTAHLDWLSIYQTNPEIEGTSDVDNMTLGSFSAQVRGSATVDNITGITVNPQMSDSSVVQNFTGINVNPQVNGTSTLVNGLTGLQVQPQGTVLLNQVTGVSIDMSNATLTPAALAAGGVKAGLTISDGALSSGYNYTVPGAAGFFQINYLGGGPIVASGDPTAAFGFGNNLAHSVTLHDDWTLDGSGLGFVDVGFVGSLGFDAGTTMAQWTGALSGAGNPSGAGTLTTAKMFSAAGILPQGGSLAVTNMYGFEVNPNLFCLVGTNCWGFYEDTATAENHMSKLAIGTATHKVANSSTAVEIGNSKGLINGRGDTATKSALTAVAGMQFYDTDLNELQWYNGTSWVSASGSGTAWGLTGNAGTTAGTNFIGTTDAQDVVFKRNSSESLRLGNNYLQFQDSGGQPWKMFPTTGGWQFTNNAAAHIGFALSTGNAFYTYDTAPRYMTILSAPGDSGTDPTAPTASVNTPVIEVRNVDTTNGNFSGVYGSNGNGGHPLDSGWAFVHDNHSAAGSQSGHLVGLVSDAGTVQSAVTFDKDMTTTLHKYGTGIAHFSSAGVISSSAVNLSTADVTGTLPVANGGTGQTSYTDGQLLIGNSTGNTLTKSTLTAGSNITITNGGGSITIASTGGGSSTVTVATKTSGYTMTNSDDVILCDGTLTITMQSVASATSKPYRIKNIGTGVCTIAPNGADTIDGQTSLISATQYQAVELIPNGGTAWYVF